MEDDRFVGGSFQTLIGFIILAVSSLLFLPLITWIEMSAFGFNGFGFLAFLCYSLVILILVPCCLFLAIMKQRKNLRVFSFASLLFVIMPIFGAFFISPYEVRLAEFRRFTVRMRPIVNAIKQYELENGTPPKELAELIPEYIDEVPSTGIGAYRDLHYDAEYILKNSKAVWKLWLEGPVNWDEFVYLSNRDYSDYETMVSFGRVGDWVYFAYD